MTRQISTRRFLAGMAFRDRFVYLHEEPFLRRLATELILMITSLFIGFLLLCIVSGAADLFYLLSPNLFRLVFPNSGA